MTVGAYATDSLKYSDCCSYNRSQMYVVVNKFSLGAYMVFFWEDWLYWLSKITRFHKIKCDWAIRADCFSYNRSQMYVVVNKFSLHVFFLGRLIVLATQNHKVSQN